MLLAAGSLFTEGKYEEAKAQFQKLIREYHDSPFMGEALLGVAACLDAQNKPTEAIAAYKELIDRHPNDPVIPQAKFALGRLYEAQNQPEQAYNYFEQVAQTDPYGSIGSEAGMRAEELKLKHPNLAPGAGPAPPTRCLSICQKAPAPAPTNSAGSAGPAAQKVAGRSAWPCPPGLPKMKLTIIGTGYVGLVTGACFAEVGHQVVCVDNDAAKVKTLQAGGIPIYEPGLEEMVARNVAAGRLSFTTSTAEGVQKSDVVFIAVPTPPLADGSVDLSFIEKVARDIAAAHDQLQDRRGQEHRAGQDRRQGGRNHQALLQGAGWTSTWSATRNSSGKALPSRT